MVKFTEMGKEKQRLLFEKFLFYLQAKYSSGTLEEIKFYEFVLRYNLLPQFFEHKYVIPKESHPLIRGYLLFLKEKFGIINYNSNKVKNFLETYSLLYSEIYAYSFNELMKNATELGVIETKLLINNLFDKTCFKNMCWMAPKNATTEDDLKIGIVKRFKNNLLYKKEQDIEKIAKITKIEILKSALPKEKKTILITYLKNVKTSITYHNAIRQMSLNVVDFYLEMQKKIIKRQEPEKSQKYFSQEK